MMDYRKNIDFFEFVISRKRMRQSFLTLLMLLMVQAISFSQNIKLKEAIDNYDKNDLEKARAAIDSAMLHPETSADSRTWYYAGFIYKKIYHQYESSDPLSAMREKAIEYFKKSISLDTDPKFSGGSLKQIKALSTSYYNDAVRTMTREHYTTSQSCHESFLQLLVITDPNTDLTKHRIEYLSALASLFTRIHDAEVEESDFYWLKARKTYEQVLILDSENLNANYNIGILFYNKAVNIINGVDYDIDLVALSDIQDTSVVLLQQALPYMETVYRLQPRNENTLMALSGIFFGLHEIEKSDEIKKELELLRMGK